MDKRHMQSTDKVEIAKQAIKEIMEEHQVTGHKPNAKHLLVQLLSQLASLQEEDVEKLCPEVDGTEQKPKEQWDSLQEEDVEKLCPEVDGTKEKPKEQCDSLQEEDVERDPLQEEGFEEWCPVVDGTEEKPNEQLNSSQEEEYAERLSPEVDKTKEEENPKEHLDSSEEEEYAERLSPEVDKTKEEENPKEQLDSSQEEGVEKSSREVDNTEEIIKEVRNIKRQNLITHCLVSTMILLTVAWQISEVSLLLKVKSGLKNPFNFFGGIVKGIMLKGARSEGDGEQSSAKQKPDSNPPLIKLPDLHLSDLPIFDSSDGE